MQVATTPSSLHSHAIHDIASHLMTGLDPAIAVRPVREPLALQPVLGCVDTCGHVDVRSS